MRSLYTLLLFCFVATVVAAQLPGDTLICPGNFPFALNAGVDGAVSYTWNTGETSPGIEVNQPGVFTVIVVTGQADTLYDTATVIAWNLPEAAVSEYHTGQVYFLDALNSAYIDDETVFTWRFHDGISATGTTVYRLYPFGIYGPYNVPIKLYMTNKCGTDSATVYAYVYLDAPQGVDEIPGAAFSTWPNPVEHTLHISGATRVDHTEVRDALGRLVPCTRQGTEVDVSGLPEGLYTLYLRDGQQAGAVRFVK